MRSLRTPRNPEAKQAHASFASPFGSALQRLSTPPPALAAGVTLEACA
jgi:hypothetical protein